MRDRARILSVVCLCLMLAACISLYDPKTVEHLTAVKQFTQAIPDSPSTEKPAASNENAEKCREFQQYEGEKKETDKRKYDRKSRRNIQNACTCYEDLVERHQTMNQFVRTSCIDATDAYLNYEDNKKREEAE